MSLGEKIGGFFKRIALDVAKVFAYLPELEKKFAKAVTDAKADTAETIAAGKPVISALAVASAKIAAVAADKGLKWTEDTEAVAAIEDVLHKWPAFWAAIEKEGSDLAADLGIGAGAASPAEGHTPVVQTTEGDK